MTCPVRSPFRRFPWVQLVFCIGCLTMTAWTWMRYSYCWDFKPAELHRLQMQGSWAGNSDYRWPWDAYAAVSGDPGVLGGEPGVLDGEQNFVARILADPRHSSLVVMVEPHSYEFLHSVGPLPGEGGSYVLFPFGSEPGQMCRFGEATITYTGRLHNRHQSEIMLYASASRFTGASVAGLLVGAMGAFIFGLYLRRWLVERNALASQPGQDMIP